MRRILCLLPENSQNLFALAEWCLRFSPLVGLEPSTPESLLIDITGAAHLAGGEAALTEQLLRELAEQGVSARAAVAGTIGAAWAVCHYGGQGTGARGQGENCKLQIVNCELQIEDGASVPLPTPHSPRPALRSSSLHPHPNPLPEGEGTEFFPRPTPHAPRPTLPSAFRLPPSALPTLPPALRPLPVEALRLPEETVGVLHQLGVRRIEQLEALPRRELSSRFGPRLIQRWDQATGRMGEPLPAYEPPSRFAVRWSPEHPAARRETIGAAIEYLVGQIAAKLFKKGRGAMRLTCRLDCDLGERIELAVGLFQPTAWAKHLSGLLEVQLDRARLPGPVTAIAVAAVLTAPLEGRQEELFSLGGPRRHPRHLAGLVERLSTRLGREAVVLARLVSEAQPERAWQSRPMVGSNGDCPVFRSAIGRRSRDAVGGGPKMGLSPFGEPMEDLPPRPLRLLVQPVPLSGVAEDSFQLFGHRYWIAHRWGPERIETGWWRGRAVGRDYYRIETTTGSRFWLFRHLRNGQWFLHGMFE